MCSVNALGLRFKVEMHQGDSNLVGVRPDYHPFAIHRLPLPGLSFPPPAGAYFIREQRDVRAIEQRG